MWFSYFVSFKGYLVSTATNSLSRAIATGPILILPLLIFGGFFVSNKWVLRLSQLYKRFDFHWAEIWNPHRGQILNGSFPTLSYIDKKEYNVTDIIFATFATSDVCCSRFTSSCFSSLIHVCPCRSPHSLGYKLRFLPHWLCLFSSVAQYRTVSSGCDICPGLTLVLKILW